jgi:hypothetical protein
MAQSDYLSTRFESVSLVTMIVEGFLPASVVGAGSFVRWSGYECFVLNSTTTDHRPADGYQSLAFDGLSLAANSLTLVEVRGFSGEARCSERNGIEHRRAL